jgi:hypothetical protein
MAAAAGDKSYVYFDVTIGGAAAGRIDDNKWILMHWFD